MKRPLALALALLLLLATPALAGNYTPGQLPLSDETITFTVGVAQSAVVEDWYTNAQTLKMQEDLNVKLEFVELPSAQADLIQKVELMIMAGGNDLPEIIMHGLGGLANLVKYGQMGMILPTNEYYETLSYYVDKACETTQLSKEDLLRYVTCYDGNIYGMFSYMESINNSYSGCRLMVYEPWLEKLGIAMPVTTDDFVNMLVAFRDQDPNGNGQADEIALMGYKDSVNTNLMRTLMNPFVYTQANYFINNDGVIEFAATQEGWKEGLIWIKSLFDQGLIDPLSLTQDQAQLTAIMSQEETVVGALARISATHLGATDIRRSEYVVLDPLQGPGGLRQSVLEPRLPGIGMVITKNCKDPEAAFLLGDYMCSEDLSVWNRFGEENVNWEAPSADAIGAYQDLGYPARIKIISTWGVLQNAWWAQVGPYVLSSAWQDGQAAENIEYNGAVAIGRSLKTTLEYTNPNPVAGLVFNEEEQEIVNEFQSTINNYVQESFAQFITGAMDPEADFDRYVAEFEKMGLNEYMEAVNSCFTRMN